MSAAQSARRTRKKAEDTSAEATDTAKDQTEDTADNASGGADTLTSELKSAVREAAVEVLKPVARKATLSVAKLAVKEGPSLFKNKLGPAASGLSDKVADAGGAGAFAKGLTSGKGGALSGITDKIPFVGGGGDDDDEDGGKGGRAATGTGRGRRLPVQEWVDVGAPIDVVYDQFTQFEDFPQFMHRVEKVEQRDDTTLMWHENIWGIRRQWEAEITDQEPNRRIAWRSDGVSTVGVITFHELAENLTRVYMTVDFQPKGFLEKSASGFRLSRRAIKSDLMRFKAYIEMRDDATGDWHGVIEDGEVAESPEEYDERMEQEGDEPEARSDEEEYEDEDEPVAEEDDEDEEYEDEPVAEEDDEDEEYEDEPVAEEDEDDEEFEDEPSDEETPRRKRRGRFARSSDSEDDEDDEEYEDDEEEEPVAEEDEDDEPVASEDDEEERPRPKRRPRAKAKPKAKAKAKPRARKSKPKAKAS